MSRRIDISRVAAGAITMGMVAAFTTAAQAQQPPDIDVQCQYFTAQSDPLEILSDVTKRFSIDPLVAVEENRKQTKLNKGTGLAAVAFEESDVVNGGLFWAEVDAKLKATSDNPFLVCAESAQVRGVGLLNVDTEEQDGVDWLIRSNSRLDGAKRSGTVADCPEGFDEDFCSVHKVKASLKITAQGARSNESLNYDRFTVTEKDIFEAYEGVAPEKGQDVVLICSCTQFEAPIEAPVEPIVEE